MTKEVAVSSPSLQTLLPEPTTVRRPSPPGLDDRLLIEAVVERMEFEDPFLARLDRMTPRQRVQASRDGGFTRQERARWACRYPEEVPTVNGEIEWIALGSADLD